MRKNVVILFPGACGNRDEQTVLWWFERQVEAIRAVDPEVVIIPVTYRGDSLKAILFNVQTDLARKFEWMRGETRVAVITYSMGQQVFAMLMEPTEGVHFFRPRCWPQFVVSISPVPSGGVPFANVAGMLAADPWPIVRAAFGGTLELKTVDEVNKVMCSGTDAELAAELLEHMHGERMYMPMAQLFVPILRVRTREPNVPGLRIVGENDAVVGRAQWPVGGAQTPMNVAGAHHAMIRNGAETIRPLWNAVADQLLGS